MCPIFYERHIPGQQEKITELKDEKYDQGESFWAKRDKQCRLFVKIP